jgi:hypothetical protein
MNRATRNNNPGNLRYTAWSKLHGATGEDRKGVPDGTPGYAIFPSSAIGIKALWDLLQGKSYRNLSLRDAFFRFAPPADNNDTVRYIKFVTGRVGASEDTLISSLSVIEFAGLVEAISIFEGFGK